MSCDSSIGEFLNRVANVLETPSVDPELEFRSLPNWCSMTGFALYVMLEDEYSVKISPDDFRTLKTVGDLMRVAGIGREALNS